MKKRIVSLLSLLLLISVISGCGCKKKNNKINGNNNQEKNISLEAKTIDDIEISNVNITYDGNNSTFTAIITNNSNETKKIGIIDIILKDKDNNEIVTLKGLVDKTIEPNNSASINAGTGIDLTNTKSIEYKID